MVWHRSMEAAAAAALDSQPNMPVVKTKPFGRVDVMTQAATDLAASRDPVRLWLAGADEIRRGARALVSPMARRWIQEKPIVSRESMAVLAADDAAPDQEPTGYGAAVLHESGRIPAAADRVAVFPADSAPDDLLRPHGLAGRLGEVVGGRFFPLLRRKPEPSDPRPVHEGAAPAKEKPIRAPLPLLRDWDPNSYWPPATLHRVGMNEIDPAIRTVKEQFKNVIKGGLIVGAASLANHIYLPNIARWTTDPWIAPLAGKVWDTVEDAYIRFVQLHTGDAADIVEAGYRADAANNLEGDRTQFGDLLKDIAEGQVSDPAGVADLGYNPYSAMLPGWDGAGIRLGPEYNHFLNALPYQIFGPDGFITNPVADLQIATVAGLGTAMLIGIGFAAGNIRRELTRMSAESRALAGASRPGVPHGITRGGGIISGEKGRRRVSYPATDS